MAFAVSRDCSGGIPISRSLSKSLILEYFISCSRDSNQDFMLKMGTQDINFNYDGNNHYSGLLKNTKCFIQL